MKLNLGSRIRELRKAKGITQEMLAEAVSVTAQAVSRWEAGTSYPDMELIPSIANYFGISIDRLFGYSLEREEKITAILEKVEELNDNSWRDDKHLDECIALLRRGLEEFPENEKLMHRLALSLKQAGWMRHREWLAYDTDGHLQSDFDRHQKNPYWLEAISLFERLFNTGSTAEVCCKAACELVLLYGKVGELEKAKSCAEKMPELEQCRELQLAAGANGAERTRYCAEACIALLKAFQRQFVYALMNERANFETDLPVKKLQGLIGIYDLLFEDGNFGPQHANVCDLYLYLSRFQWEWGYRDEAFESLDAALMHARKFDALKENARYSAPLIRNARLKLPPVVPGDLARNLPNDWPMWQLPDYSKVAQEIKQDPRWDAWVKRAHE